MWFNELREYYLIVYNKNSNKQYVECAVRYIERGLTQTGLTALHRRTTTGRLTKQE
jgi:hypothetical protein